jgi:hypothetical protein
MLGREKMAHELELGAHTWMGKDIVDREGYREHRVELYGKRIRRKNGLWDCVEWRCGDFVLGDARRNLDDFIPGGYDGLLDILSLRRIENGFHRWIGGLLLCGKGNLAFGTSDFLCGMDHGLVDSIRMRDGFPCCDEKTQTRLYEWAGESFLRVLNLEGDAIVSFDSRPDEKIWKVLCPRFDHSIRKRRTVDVHRGRTIPRPRNIMLHNGAELRARSPTGAVTNKLSNAKGVELSVRLTLNLDAVHEIERRTMTWRKLHTHRDRVCHGSHNIHAWGLDDFAEENVVCAGDSRENDGPRCFERCVGRHAIGSQMA